MCNTATVDYLLNSDKLSKCLPILPNQLKSQSPTNSHARPFIPASESRRKRLRIHAFTARDGSTSSTSSLCWFGDASIKCIWLENPSWILNIWSARWLDVFTVRDRDDELEYILLSIVLVSLFFLYAITRFDNLAFFRLLPNSTERFDKLIFGWIDRFTDFSILFFFICLKACQRYFVFLFFHASTRDISSTKKSMLSIYFFFITEWSTWKLFKSEIYYRNIYNQTNPI